MTPLPYRLRLPGPISVPERVRQAMEQPTLSHRGSELIAILERAEKLLLPILGILTPGQQMVNGFAMRRLQERPGPLPGRESYRVYRQVNP